MKNSRFEFFSSIMIALITITSAIVAWRSSVASVAAGDADFEGLATSVRAQEAEIINNLLAYEHYHAYTQYFRYNELGHALNNSGLTNAEEEASVFWGIAQGLQFSFFPSQYLNQEGNYEIQREIEELWAESNMLTDLNPVPHFFKADEFRDKGTLLTGTMIGFAIAFFLFAAGQAMKSKLKFLFAITGLGTYLIVVMITVFIEFFMNA